MKNYRNALAELKEAVKGLCYQNPMAHYYQGMTLLQMKKYDDARLKFSEIQTTFRKSPFANKAHARMIELERIESNTNQSDDVQATRTVLESPDF
jgi:outer membrane protein assembly factor BamD (BamD/ComL family)